MVQCKEGLLGILNGRFNVVSMLQIAPSETGGIYARVHIIQHAPHAHRHTHKEKVLCSSSTKLKSLSILNQILF